MNAIIKKNGLDISNKIGSFKLDIATTSFVDSVKMNTIEQMQPGDEIEIAINNATAFKGKVESSTKNDDGTYDVIALGEGNQLNKIRAVEVFINKSPEYIVQYLIDKYTTLKYASTSTSNITISKYVLDDFISRAVNDMANILDWQARIEYSSSGSSWYNQNWKYRLPITITEQSGQNLTDYQVKITIDTASLVSQGKMNPDGSDIRITSSDGITDLPFWIEDGTMNTTNTNIWVKVPSIPANGTTTVYMYYGNPTSTSASDVNTTALDVIPDLEIYIPFDEGSGSVANDYSGNGINGTLSSGVSWTTGRFGGAVSFPDSNNKKVTYGTVPSITGTSITLLAWVYRTATNGTGWNIVASKWFTAAGAGSTQDFHFDTTNFGQIRLYTNGGYRGSVNINFSNNQWRHIGFAVNQSTNQVHFIADGQIKYTTAGNRPTSSASTLMNGDARNGYGLIGYIDSFMIFKRVLTSTELTNIYNGRYLTSSSLPNNLIVFKYVQQDPLVSLGTEESIAIKFYFEPKGLIDSNKTYEIGINCNLTEKITDTTKMANSIQIKGDKQEFQTVETFTGDGTTTEFQVLYYPEQVRVTIDGVEKQGGVTQGDGDYYVDKVNKKIIFNTAPASGSTIEITYSYLVPISIRMEDPNSISQYGTYSKKIVNTNLKTFDDARKYGRAYLSSYANPITSYKIMVPGWDDVAVGSRATFIYNQENTNKQLTINRKTFVFPEGYTEITLGETIEDTIIWQEDVQARILNLEKAMSNETIVQDYRLISEQIPIGIKVSRLTIKYRDKTGIIILDDPDVKLDDTSFKLDEQFIKPWTIHYEVTN